jgi:hypothetical protein
MTDRAPLVPAEVDLRDFQYMELDVRRLRDSRFGAEVSGDAFRAGVMLWCAAWHQVPASSLPDDDIELANLAGYGRFVKEWKKVRAQALQGFVPCSDGRLYHEVVAEKALQAWDSKLHHQYDRARDRLRKLNKQRATESLPPIPELTFEQWNERRIAGGIPMERADASGGIPPKPPAEDSGIPAENALRGNREGTEKERNGEGDLGKEKSAATPPPAPPEPPPAADAAPTPRATRLRADWALPKAWGEWALAEFPHWTPDTVRRIAEGFADHWRGKAGKDATKADWLATWRNWCRSDITQRQFPPPRAANGSHHPGGQPPLDELTAGVQRRLGITPDQEVLDA